MSHGKIDHSELQCCGRQMQVDATIPAYICEQCRWGVTRIEFTRSYHLPNVTAAIAARELGRQF